MNFKWAINKDKLSQAVAWAKGQGEINEEVVKARYIQLAGLVREIKVEAKVVEKKGKKSEAKPNK